MSGELKISIPKFTELNEFASQANGGRIIFATDDWFANAENMLNDTEPIFIPDKYTEFGKWMDGWETRRKRKAGHDWCIIKLAAPCIVKGITIDTAYFTGNYAPKISVQGTVLSENEERMLPERKSEMGCECTDDQMNSMLKLKTENWTQLIPMTKMRPGYEETRKNYVSININKICSYLRVNVYPDGGIARLRVYGEVVPNYQRLRNSKVKIDLIAMENGGACIKYSNAHYGHPRNLIKPNRGINMGDGWETMRRLDRPPILKCDKNGILQVPGNEWTVIKMCSIGCINNIIVDTCHFKGNYPDSVKIEAALLNDDDSLTLQSIEWSTILPSQKLSAHKEHFYASNELTCDQDDYFNYVKIIMAPDGGISRVRIFGHLQSE